MKFPSLTEVQGRNRTSRTGLPPSRASVPVSREAGAGSLPKVDCATERNSGLALASSFDTAGFMTFRTFQN